MALQTDRQKMAHVLRRFGLGASEAELNFYSAKGFEAGIDTLLNYEDTDEGFDLRPDAAIDKKGKVNFNLLILWWITRLLVTQRPLQEKMTLFWHNHFATSAEKVKGTGNMYNQNLLLRANATGNFRTLLHAVSKDPAMIFWLDTQEDRVGHPNENFAREVMELFTLGVGNYTEHDIQQSARAYTGWSIRRVPGTQASAMPSQEFIYRPRLHDDTPKTFFGKTGDFDGDQILDMLCDMERNSEFIVWKLWTFFAYAKPEDSVVSKYAKIFRDNNLEIKPLLKAIMMGDEFYSAKADRTMFKNPCDISVATARQLGIGAAIAANLKQIGPDGVAPRGPVSAVAVSMKNQGMELFYPPDVAGWRLGQNWISSATLIARIQWGEQLYGQSKSKVPQVFVNPYSIFASDTSPEGVARELVKLYDAGTPESKISSLVAAAKNVCGNQVTEENAAATAAQVSRIIFATPEFQFS